MIETIFFTVPRYFHRPSLLCEFHPPSAFQPSSKHRHPLSFRNLLASRDLADLLLARANYIYEEKRTSSRYSALGVTAAAATAAAYYFSTPFGSGNCEELFTYRRRAELFRMFLSFGVFLLAMSFGVVAITLIIIASAVTRCES